MTLFGAPSLLLLPFTAELVPAGAYPSRSLLSLLGPTILCRGRACICEHDKDRQGFVGNALRNLILDNSQISKRRRQKLSRLVWHTQKTRPPLTNTQAQQGVRRARALHQMRTRSWLGRYSGSPGLTSKAVYQASMLRTVLTRYSAGAWQSVRICCRSAASRILFRQPPP
jgi:hypothetical protein